jgi:enoyl-CoA hydratase
VTGNVLVARDGGVATVTVNRPEARNALDAETLDGLAAAFTELGRDTEVRCAILTGAGDKAFVAGADIKAMVDMDAAAGLVFAERGHRTFELIESLRLPVIAAANGWTLGAGCELALACDFIYAARTAKFGMPEVGLGVIPGFGGTQRLALRVGVARARELIYTGATIDAPEALRIGLANGVAEPEALLPAVRAIAATVAGKAPLAIAAAKRVVSPGALRDAGEPLARAQAAERAAFAGLFATADQKEGMRAFIDKRQPAWKGA